MGIFSIEQGILEPDVQREVLTTLSVWTEILSQHRREDVCFELASYSVECGIERDGFNPVFHESNFGFGSPLRSTNEFRLRPYAGWSK